MKHHIRGLLIMGLSVCLSPFVSAQTWDNDSNDFKWNTGANWSGGSVPASGASVTFNNTGVGVIDLDIAPTVGNVTFDASAGAFTFTNNNLTVNGGSTLSNASSSLQLFSGNVAFGEIFFRGSGNGEVRFTGINTAGDIKPWTGAVVNFAGGSINAGEYRSRGDSVLIYSGGLKATNNTVYFGIDNGSASTNNTLVVRDSGTHWRVNGGITMSWDQGGNRLVVTNGAEVYATGQLRMGDPGAGSNNYVLVSGNGTSLRATDTYVGLSGQSNRMDILNEAHYHAQGELVVGYFGGGSNSVLNILGGATLTNTSLGRLGDNGARAVVSDEGSRWNMAGELRLGDGGSASNTRMIISNGAVVTADGNGYLNIGGASNHMTLTGIGSSLTIGNEFHANWNSQADARMIIDQGARMIVSNRLNVQNANTTFDFLGGRLEVGNIYVNDDDFTVGDGSQKATFQMNNIGASAMFNSKRVVMTSNSVFAIGGAQSISLSTLLSSYIVTNVGSGFGGTGTLVGDFVYENGSTVAPGNSPGTFTQQGDVGFGGGGNYDWEINSFGGTAGASTGWDLFDIDGALDISATSGDRFNINLISLTAGNLPGMVADFDGSTDYALLIAQATSIAGFSADKFNINTDNFLNGYVGSWTVGVDGNAIYLYYTAIPEPSTYAALILGAVFFFGIRLLRRKPAPNAA